MVAVNLIGASAAVVLPVGVLLVGGVNSSRTKNRIKGIVPVIKMKTLHFDSRSLFYMVKFRMMSNC